MPPSLSVLAALITNNKRLEYVVAQLEDRCYMGTSYTELRGCGWPEVKVASANIGNGLAVTYTETLDRSAEFGACGRLGLVWVFEMSCHPFCSLLGRACQGEKSTDEWLKIIEKKHIEMLDRIPSV